MNDKYKVIKHKSETTPTEWRIHNRNRSEALAHMAQKRIEGKVLVKVDDKTWVYVNPGEKPKPVISRAFDYL